MADAYTPKERVLKALAHDEADRVPIYITVTPQVAAALSHRLGMDSYTHADSPLSENRISFHELLLELGNDFIGTGACAPITAPTTEVEPGIFVDEWKVVYRKIGDYSEMIEYPLAHASTMADVDRYEFPDPEAPGRFKLAHETFERYGEEYAICGDLECTVFEAAWHLTGMEKFLTDLLDGKPYVYALMDRIADYSVGVGRELLWLGADMIWLGDDMGTQTGMLLSPDLWRRHIKPRLASVIERLKAEDSMVLFAYHCCGSFYPIVADLIEIGIDVLNALQPTAKDMDIGRLKREYGDWVCLWGGVDIQGVVPFGTMDDVEEEVKRVMREAAVGGGYIFGGAHNIQPDTSVEKVIALFELAKKYGRYPISGV